MCTVGQQLLLLSSMCLFLALLCAFCPSDFIFTCYQWFNLQFLASEITCIQCVGVWGEVKVLNIDFQTTFHLPSPPTPSTHFIFFLHNFPSSSIKSFQILCSAGILKWLVVETSSLFINISLCMAGACDSNYQCHFAAVSAKFFWDLLFFFILELINMCSIWYSQLEAVLCKLNCIYMDIIYWVLR